jgi:hypothetical protein
VGCLPEHADGLHEHVLDHDADIAAAEPLGPPPQLLEVGLCSQSGRKEKAFRRIHKQSVNQEQEVKQVSQTMPYDSDSMPLQPARSIRCNMLGESRAARDGKSLQPVSQSVGQKKAVRRV